MSQHNLTISILRFGLWNNEEYLLFAEEDYDAFCLAYMFTYRDFEMGTLGLAWTGDLKNAGGVCEKNGVSWIKTYALLQTDIVLKKTVFS